MAKPNVRLDAARKAYREALDAARGNATPEAWAKLLAAGKELSAAEDPRSRGRRGRRRGERVEEVVAPAEIAPTEIAPTEIPSPDSIEHGEGAE